MRSKNNRCKRGHEFTPENTVTTHRERRCVECMRLRGQMKSAILLDVGSPANIIAYIESRSVQQESGCREWVGARDGHGYGNIRKGNKNYRAHRLMMTGVLGRELDVSECVLHRCDNPLCVNPGHLFIGSHVDNSMDMAAKGRTGNTKLTYEHVLEVKAALAKLTADLALHYGVSRSVIANVQFGRTHKHVAPPCICPRLHFPHRATGDCADIIEQLRINGDEIKQQQAAEWANERGQVAREMNR